eukprot:580401-Rhodomonas_salina.3
MRRGRAIVSTVAVAIRRAIVMVTTRVTRRHEPTFLVPIGLSLRFRVDCGLSSRSLIPPLTGRLTGSGRQSLGLGLGLGAETNTSRLLVTGTTALLLGAVALRTRAPRRSQAPRDLTSGSSHWHCPRARAFRARGAGRWSFQVAGARGVG